LKIASVEIFPTKIELQHRFDYRQLLILGKLDTGETVDLTRLAKLATPSKIATVTANGVVRPTADGQEQLTFTYATHSVNIPVAVANSKTNPSNRHSLEWAAMLAPATGRRMARRDSSCRFAVTTLNMTISR
jgi:hypothetical protein